MYKSRANDLQMNAAEVHYYVRCCSTIREFSHFLVQSHLFFAPETRRVRAWRLALSVEGACTAA